MQQMMVNETQGTEFIAGDAGMDPINAVIIIVAGGFYNDLQRLNKNCDPEVLKKTVKSQIGILEGLYKRI